MRPDADACGLDVRPLSIGSGLLFDGDRLFYGFTHVTQSEIVYRLISLTVFFSLNTGYFLS